MEEHLEGLFTEEDPLGARHEESVTVADGRGESLVAEFYESPSANDEAHIERGMPQKTTGSLEMDARDAR